MRRILGVLAVMALLLASACETQITNLSGTTSTPNGTLNLRSCGSTTCTVLRRVPHGTVLSFTATSGDWFKTTYSGATGWVSSPFVILRGTPASTSSRGTTSRRTVSYTFDAGADLGYTGQILDFLKANGMKASFGLTGTWVDAHPAVVQRMANEGHHLLNHTWSHDSLTGRSTNQARLSPARRTEELVKTDNRIVALTGRSTKPYFRPPYGDYDSSVLRDVGANGYSRSVMWSVDSLGWRGLTASQICSRVVGAVDAASYGGNGFIILFHVGGESRDASALPCITTALRARGFSFGTVAQVIAS
jgi:peptidoglycan/xylan/chitin deacetylase (PgdA/CDA1 family)